MIPIPATEQKFLEKSTANFSLLSPRIVEWGKNKRGEFASNTEMMQTLYQKSKTSFSSSSELLENNQKKQKAYINYLKEMNVISFEIKAKSTSPFITGLGSGHPTETGMILDRNTGLPYIPASSIKGVLRLSCAVNLANKKYSDGNVPDDDEILVKYFGSESDSNPKRGQLIILDAYPEQVPKLKVDIMNPHFGMYYSGENKQPVETESPVPIKFLAVKEGVTFVFRWAFMPLGNKILSDEEKQTVQTEVNAMFDTAFETVGFGEKTAIGYGRFKKIEGK